MRKSHLIFQSGSGVEMDLITWFSRITWDLRGKQEEGLSWQFDARKRIEGSVVALWCVCG